MIDLSTEKCRLKKYLCFQGKVYNDRRARGLHPYLPEVEDREKIKQEYLGKVRFT